MLNRMHTRLREDDADGDRGFTLIELLVVVVIVGILIAVAIPLYLHFEKGANNSGAGSDVHDAIAIVDQCQADNDGVIPDPGGVTGNGVQDADLVFTCRAGNQTATVSKGDTLTYAYKSGDTANYTLTGTSAEGGKTYTYDSSTGKITQS